MPRPASKGLSLWLILGLLLVALALLTPSRFLPWLAFRQELLAAVAFVFITIGVAEHGGGVRWPWLAFVALAAAAIPLIQYSAGLILFRGDAVLVAVYLAGFACSMCIGATLGRSEYRGQLFNGLVACLVFVAITSTGLALSQWLGPSPWGDWILTVPASGRPCGNVGQPNHLATLLALGIGALLVRLEQRKIGLWATAIGVVWLGWGMALTQSRTGWLIVVLLCVWWALMRTRVGIRLAPSAVTAGLILFALAVVIQASVQYPVLEVGASKADAASPQVRLAPGTRLAHWQILWDALWRAPWAGYGWNQVSNAHSVAAIDHPAIREWAMHSHNLVLDLLIYNGVFLGLLLCTALVAWFARRYRECRTIESWYLLFALLALVAHAMLEYPLHYLYFLLPAGLMMGMLEDASAKVRRSASKWTLFLPVLGLTALGGAIATEYAKAEEALRDLELAVRGVGPPAADLPRADWYFVDGWSAYHRAATVPIDHNLSEDDYQNLEHVAARYAYPYILERFAYAAALRGEVATAQRVLRLSCKIHSLNTCVGMKSRWSALQEMPVEFPPVDPN